METPRQKISCRFRYNFLPSTEIKRKPIGSDTQSLSDEIVVSYNLGFSGVQSIGSAFTENSALPRLSVLTEVLIPNPFMVTSTVCDSLGPSSCIQPYISFPESVFLICTE